MNDKPVSDSIDFTSVDESPLDSLKARIGRLERDKARYLSMFAQSGAPAIIVEADMSISLANEKFEELVGYSRAEIEGRIMWPDFMAMEDRERMKKYHRLRRIEGQTVPEEYECKVIHRDGRVRNIYMKVGMLPGMKTSIANFMDITSRKRAEEALVESQRRLATLLGNLPGMAYRCRQDNQRTMAFASEGCQGLTGYAPSDLVANKTCAYGDLIHPDDRPRLTETIAQALSSQHSFEMVYRIRTATGDEKWVWEKGVGVFTSESKLLALEGFITDFSDQKQSEQALVRENLRLRSTMRDRYQFGNIVGKSQAMQKVYQLIMNAAASDANMIIYGESGTGKELVARAIHELSDRKGCGFVPVNCGAIPDNLIESEFFGYAKGAFSGAGQAKQGYLDTADKGTLFLDELGEINQNMQVKLLRAIEGGGYTPLGSSGVRRPDIRIVAATNRDLRQMVRQGLIREDFFYRIHIIPIQLPALRQRKEDLPLLIDHFLKQEYSDKHPPRIPGQVLDALLNYHWPGNVRELQNVLHRYVTLGQLDFLEPPPAQPAETTLPDVGQSAAAPDYQTAMTDFEKALFIKALENHRWHREKAAASLGVSRRTFFRKLKKLGLSDH
jgi:PAS domain S-box-containing protein